jgi:hypothetical protein
VCTGILAWERPAAATRSGSRNLHPIDRYEDPQDTGSPAHDGYTLLSRADPKAQGAPPAVEGTIGQVYRGPDRAMPASGKSRRGRRHAGSAHFD